MQEASLGTFAWLVRRRVAGRFRRALRRIRQSPRHLLMVLPLLYPIVYFAFVFGDARSTDGRAVTTPLFVLLALLAVLRPFFRADGAQAIAFTGDEVQWIATAPLSRTRLLAYAVFRAAPPLLYFGLYWSALMWVTGVRGTLPAMVVGLFVFGLTLTLLSMSAEMVAALLARNGIGATARRVVLGGALLALVYLGAEPFRGGPPPGDVEAMVAWASERSELSVASDVLAPFIELARLPAPDAWFPWLVRLGIVLAVDVALFGLVAMLPVPVEELALAGAHRMRRARSRLGIGSAKEGPRRRSKRLAQRAGPRLAETGRPWLALVWMSFVGAWRRIRPSPLFLAIVAAALGAALATDNAELAAIVSITLVLLVILMTLMGTALTDPLRSTLSGLVSHLATLRGWPVASSTVARSFAIGGGTALAIGPAALTLVALLLLVRDLDVEWVVVAVGSAAAMWPVHVFLVSIRDAIAITWPDLHRPAADLGAMRSANIVIGLLRALFFFVGLGLALGFGGVTAFLLAAVFEAPLLLTHPIAILLLSLTLLLFTELFTRWSGHRLTRDTD